MHPTYFYTATTFAQTYALSVILRVFPAEQMMEDLRERYFGPTFELKSHDKVLIINLPRLETAK